VADLANDLPPNDLTLIANVGSLVVRDDLHPALQYLPARRRISRPLRARRLRSWSPISSRGSGGPAAQQPGPVFLPVGPPFLQRYLPFWLAMLAERLLFVVIPVVGIIYPVARFLPGFYGWSMRRRIYRLYGELKFLEADLERRDPGRPVDDIDARLTDLEHRANSMRVP